jgi:hypothetical protein
LKWKLYTKAIKTPSWEAWVQRANGLIKNGGKQELLREATLIKVENDL